MRGRHNLHLFWIVALFISIAVIFICFFQRVNSCIKTDGRQNSNDLRETIIQQASISWGDVGEFVEYLDQAVGPIGEVCAVIPPFACSQCISRILQQLDDLGLPVDLMVPEGRFAETLPPLGPTISVTNYSSPDSASPVCFYPDLLFVVKEDGCLADYYLHDKEVPEAMAIFLYRVSAE